MLRRARVDFQRIDLAATGLRSLAWDRDKLVDWLGGNHYSLDEQREEAAGAGGFRFDAAADDG